jgi:hypothetical protein
MHNKCLLGAKKLWLSQLLVYLTISSLTTAALAQSHKKFRLELIRFNEAADAEVGENAIRAGLAAAGLVEKPANIPFLPITDYILIVNKRSAEAYRVTIPQEILDRATSIIE